jgi:hypothetical protein
METSLFLEFFNERILISSVNLSRALEAMTYLWQNSLQHEICYGSRNDEVHPMIEIVELRLIILEVSISLEPIVD